MSVGITSGEAGPNARGERKDTRVSWLTPALTPVAQGRAGILTISSLPPACGPVARNALPPVLPCSSSS
jgi:hypothetical protein